VPLIVMMRAVSSCGLEAGFSSAKPAGRNEAMECERAMVNLLSGGYAMQRTRGGDGVDARPVHASTLRRTPAHWQSAGDDRQSAADKWQ
jgi:hypothetical protein